MEKICVFCGSSMGNNDIYQKQAKHLAEVFFKYKISLVFGGSNIGLMKIMADRLMELGGEVIGVMPRFLADKEIFHEGITKLHVVENMAERKTLMAELSEGFIAIPGGLGTLDELLEMMTLNQLRIQDKPVSILNTNGFFDSLMNFFDHAVQEGFVREEHRNNFIISEDLEVLLDGMNSFKPIETKKWITDIRKESSNK
jgi:uncharacterized protein (TIGR00730 family)